jgi:hypothetical protein
MWRFLLIAVLFCGPSEAVVEKAMTRNSMAREADTVVVGRVVGLQSIIENGQAWTIATVSCERSLKGKATATIEVRIPGGERKIGGRTLVTRVEDSPVLNINQKTLLFLNRDEDNHHHLTGLKHGCLRVESRNGIEVVEPLDPDETTEAVPLDLFLREIGAGLKERIQR